MTTTTNQKLDDLYSELGIIEDKEIFCIEAGLSDKLKEAREEMRPIKDKINIIEGWEVYPEGC